MYHRKILLVILVAVGIVLVVLGVEGSIGSDGFTLVSCPADGAPRPCGPRVYTLDLVAVGIGMAEMIYGTYALLKRR